VDRKKRKRKAGKKILRIHISERTVCEGVSKKSGGKREEGVSYSERRGKYRKKAKRSKGRRKRGNCCYEQFIEPIMGP